MFSSLGFGAEGLGLHQGLDPALRRQPGRQRLDLRPHRRTGRATRRPVGFYSLSYSMYYVLNLASYYLYSGDLDFVRSQYAIVQRQMAYNRALVDPTSGPADLQQQRARLGLLRRRQAGRGDRVQRDLLQGADRRRRHGERARQHGRRRADVATRRRRPTSSSASTRRCSTPRAASTSWPTATTPTTPATRCRRTPTPRRSAFGIAPASAHAGILSWLRDQPVGAVRPAAVLAPTRTTRR